MRCTCESHKVFQEPDLEAKISSGLSEVKSLGGWFTLYQCQVCGSYWEKHYPQGEYHGGGPAELRRVNEEYIREKYGVNV